MMLPWKIKVSLPKKRPLKTLVWAATREDAHLLASSSYVGAKISTPKKAESDEFVRPASGKPVQ